VAAASWVKEIGGAGSCKCPTDQIMAAQNFNFAPKFFQNGGFHAQILHFGTKIFRQEDFPTILRQNKNTERSNCPLLPFCHDATVLWEVNYMCWSLEGQTPQPSDKSNIVEATKRTLTTVTVNTLRQGKPITTYTLATGRLIATFHRLHHIRKKRIPEGYVNKI